MYSGNHAAPVTAVVNRFVSLLPTLPRKSDGMLAKVEVGKMVGNFKMLI